MADAEEVAQEVFLTYLQNSPALNNDEHEKAWLIRTTINKSKNMQKTGSAVNIEGTITEVNANSNSFKIGDLWVTVTNKIQLGIKGLQLQQNHQKNYCKKNLKLETSFRVIHLKMLLLEKSLPT
ncbi:RNA polymerase sigma factor [Lysinibacillus sp. NPDC093712]|uniref:RNA polymerase sigma factor n=1 Tax=Lysinibacillus sp. NPDC093712 TaxID=3390579 RepID=UPI003D03F5E4